MKMNFYFMSDLDVAAALYPDAPLFCSSNYLRYNYLYFLIDSAEPDRALVIGFALPAYEA